MNGLAVKFDKLEQSQQVHTQSLSQSPSRSNPSYSYSLGSGGGGGGEGLGLGLGESESESESDPSAESESESNTEPIGRSGNGNDNDDTHGTDSKLPKLLHELGKWVGYSTHMSSGSGSGGSSTGSSGRLGVGLGDKAPSNMHSTSMFIKGFGAVTCAVAERTQHYSQLLSDGMLMGMYRCMCVYPPYTLSTPPHTHM